jgi:hypothetical protein
MPGLRKFRKKIIIIAALASVILAFPASAARATVDNETKRELSITYADNNYDDLKVEPVSVKLYKVAEMDTEGEYKVLSDYTDVLDLSDAFASDEDSDETSFAKAEKLAEASEQILSIIAEKNYEPTETLTIEGGKVETDLVPGVYLVQTESVTTENYRYDFSPSLVAIPGTYKMELKPEQHPLTGDLIITKKLPEYHSLTGTPLFVFDVEAVNDKEETVFSDVVSLAFDEGTVKSAKVTDIPVGSKVTVTEVYATASYEVSGDSSVTVEIVSDEEPATAEFTNDYNDGLIYTTGVVNHFEVDTKTESDGKTIYSWKWEQLEDNEQEVGDEAVLE